jgi:hypothetical protein
LKLFRYKYTPTKSIFKSSVTGKISSYDQGGFVKIFGSSQEEFKQEIEELKEK